jgi:hypothetical protein
VTVSADQGGKSMALIVYRYAFDTSRKLLDVAIDYRNIVAHEPSALQVAPLADWVFHIVLNSSRSTVMYWGWPAFLEPAFQSHLPASARHREWMRLDLATLLQTSGGQIGPPEPVKPDETLRVRI